MKLQLKTGTLMVWKSVGKINVCGFINTVNDTELSTLCVAILMKLCQTEFCFLPAGNTVSHLPWDSNTSRLYNYFVVCFQSSIRFCEKNMFGMYIVNVCIIGVVRRMRYFYLTSFFDASSLSVWLKVKRWTLLKLRRPKYRTTKPWLSWTVCNCSRCFLSH